MKTFRNLDLDLISFILFVLVIGVVVCYGPYKRLTTLWTCLDNGYTSAVWTPKHGGMCSRVENGNSMLVKVTDLK
jgi:hypothetical protein